MAMGDREAAHRDYKDALNARAAAQKLFEIGSPQHIAADARVAEALSKLPTPLGADPLFLCLIRDKP